MNRLGGPEAGDGGAGLKAAAAPKARPGTLVVVAGTGTEVGKTWVACSLARELRQKGLTVAARKPAQSYDPADAGAGVATDAELLAGATGESVDAVCPAHRWYPRAMAPPMAAESLGLAPFTLGELVAELSWAGSPDVGLVEQAGGVGSPHAVDGDGVALVELIKPDGVLLVAGPGLGTLSNIRLAVLALGPFRPLVYLNRFDPADHLHAANRRWLSERDGLVVLTGPGALAEWVLGLRRSASSAP